MRDIFKKNLRDKNKMIALAIILVLIVYIDFAFILKNRFNRLKVIRPKIEKIKKDIKKYNEDISSLMAARRQAGERTPEYAKEILERIITEEKIMLVLEDVSKFANKRRVKITRITPVRSSENPVKVTSTAKYFPLLINLQMFSDYHQLGKFINDLENADIFMEVRELKIGSAAKDYQGQQINLILGAYVKE